MPEADGEGAVGDFAVRDETGMVKRVALYLSVVELVIGAIAVSGCPEFGSHGPALPGNGYHRFTDVILINILPVNGLLCR